MSHEGGISFTGIILILLVLIIEGVVLFYSLDLIIRTISLLISIIIIFNIYLRYRWLG